MTGAQEQDLLGWELMMEGVISRQWRETQAVYWKTYKSRKSSKWWMTVLIQKLLQIAWDMWQHQNHVLHNSKSNQSTILEGNTNAQLQAIYDLGSSSIPKEARILWKCTKKELIALPLYKQQWIEMAIIAQQKSNSLPDHTKVNGDTCKLGPFI